MDNFGNIRQDQAVKLLAFVTKLAKAEPNRDYPYGSVGDHLSTSWIDLAQDLLDELKLNGDSHETTKV